MFPYDYKTEPGAWGPVASAVGPGDPRNGPPYSGAAASAVTTTVSTPAGEAHYTYPQNGGGYAQQQQTQQAQPQQQQPPTPHQQSPYSQQQQPYYHQQQQASPTGYYTGPGPGDPGGAGSPHNGHDGYNPGYSQQHTPPQQQQQQPNAGTFAAQQGPNSHPLNYYQQCNQGQSPHQQQYEYNYYGNNGQWPGNHYPQQQQPYIKSEAPYVKQECYDNSGVKPGASPQNPYYSGGGHNGSPHSPHLMGMNQAGNPMPHMQPHPALHPGNAKPARPPANGKRTKESQPRITDEFKAAKKPRSTAKRTNNRFNGMSEEEVAKRGLPDYLRPGLDIVFIGINPSMFAAYTGKYYDGPGNHFWQALYLSGLLSEPMSAVDDHKLLDLGIGFTNIVARTTRGLADLSRKEIADGAQVLREKLCHFKPKIAVFNGKAIYEVYSGQKKFMFGRQPEPLNGGSTWLWVMPSSSARCAQLPRAVDKVPFFQALRKFRDHLTGRLPKLEDCEVVFANVALRNWPSKNAIKTEQQQQGGEIDPNLEPWTDGIPANVPQSVSDVIEQVVRTFSVGD